MDEKKTQTKLCKHCKTEIPKEAKVCPNCRKKQGGKLKWIIIAVLVIGVCGAAAGGGDEAGRESSSKDVEDTIAKETVTTKEEKDKPKEEVTEEDTQKEEVPEEKQVEYIAISADELSSALDSNAMKAQEEYKGKDLAITGKLGTVDSAGSYIAIETNDNWDFTNIQCYLQSEEQKQIIKEMTKGDAITIKGHCTDVGEIMGYSIDIDSIEK